MLVRRTFNPYLSQAAFDRTFQQLVAGFASPTVRGPAVHATRTDGTLTLTVDLPGVPAEAIDVEVSGRSLTLKVDHQGSSWSRTTRLGADYDLDTLDAQYLNGRLTVTVGTAPAPEVRKVAVSTTPVVTEAVEAGETPVAETTEVTAVGEAAAEVAEA